MASLDHAMWFHRPFRADEWLLYDQGTPSTSDARGLALGSIFTQDGRLVVSVVQEGLIRRRVVTAGPDGQPSAPWPGWPAACGERAQHIPVAPTPVPVRTTAVAPATTAAGTTAPRPRHHHGVAPRPPSRRVGGSLDRRRRSG